MSGSFKGWAAVADGLNEIAAGTDIELNQGQRSSLRKIAERLPENGLVLADEVGMGKTRIASAVARAVVRAGGRVAVLVPPGLGYQWRQELADGGVQAQPILRSLLQYLSAWEHSENMRPWFDESCVIVSHAFTNWRLGENSDPWRWALLPEFFAHWTQATQGQFPENYSRKHRLDDGWVKRAARSIVEAVLRQGGGSRDRSLANDLANNTPWPGALDAKKYERYAELRPWLERAVGLGLGVFDLVIIDEAHKSRGGESGLSRLLDSVIQQPRELHRRRLALTATPVELGINQWQQMFARVDLKSNLVQNIISQYSDAVQAVRLTPRDSEAREGFKRAAVAFENALRPFLIRRDKREEKSIQDFVKHTGEAHHEYRRLSEILIKPEHLAPAWRESICAAEALSFSARHIDDATAKRLRLTVGNGHGISKLIEQTQEADPDNAAQDPSDPADIEFTSGSMPSADMKKRSERSAWWMRVLLGPFHGQEEAEMPLYDHPAILAAVEAIERVVQAGEKVLVFGRFTRPMAALVNLLNARQMLRTLDSSDGFWPQEQVHLSDWHATEAAHRQLHERGGLNRDELNDRLKARYRLLEARREGFRESLVARLESGFAALGQESAFRPLFSAFKAATQIPGPGRRTLPTIARALSDHLGEASDKVSEEELVVAFSELVLAASDRDLGEEDAGERDDEDSTERWEAIEARVRDEYSHAQGGFARMLHGGSLPATRRLLQLAFNRRHAFPQVLVAQSAVGREGLNLHKACRTVLLLHPEWNPAVVEQQIGRVDRLGSLWEEMLQQAIADQVSSEDMPRIEILPIVFEGTYDQTNWWVLQERWNELRAQLHGVILTGQQVGNDPSMSRLVEEINQDAPSFSPTPRPVAV